MKLTVAIFALLLLPSLTLAAWWNPFTWFGDSAETVPVEVPAQNQGESFPNEGAFSNMSEEVESDVVAGSVREEVNTATEIVGQSCFVQEQTIAKLRQENTRLLSQYSELRTRFAQLERELAQLRNSNSETATVKSTDPYVVEQVTVSSIDMQTSTTTAAVRWKTNVPTNARLILDRSGDEELHVSDQQIASQHSVTLERLDPNTTYSFEIVARSKDNEETSMFGVFTTKRLYRAVYEGKDSEKCHEYVVEDDEGTKLANTEVQLVSYMFGKETLTTNKSGEVRFCRQGEAEEVVNIQTGEVYSVVAR